MLRRLIIIAIFTTACLVLHAQSGHELKIIEASGTNYTESRTTSMHVSYVLQRADQRVLLGSEISSEFEADVDLFEEEDRIFRRSRIRTAISQVRQAGTVELMKTEHPLSGRTVVVELGEEPSITAPKPFPDDVAETDFVWRIDDLVLPTETVEIGASWKPKAERLAALFPGVEMKELEVSFTLTSIDDGQATIGMTVKFVHPTEAGRMKVDGEGTFHYSLDRHLLVSGELKATIELSLEKEDEMSLLGPVKPGDEPGTTVLDGSGSMKVHFSRAFPAEDGE